MSKFDGISWVCNVQEGITMGGKGGGSSGGTVTSTQTPPPEVMAQYKNVIGQANDVASNPLQLYQGNLVAPFTGAQNAAFDTINNAQGMATPYNQQATSNLQDSTVPIWNQVQQFSPQAVQQYMNPYTQNVVDATRANMAQTNAVNNQGLISRAIGSGAFGGDRAGIAQAEQNRTQSLADNQTIAGLYNQSYNSGLGAFQQQQGQQQQAAAQSAALNQQAASLYSGLGNTAMNQALTGAQAQLGAGTLQQQLAQAQLNVPYQQYQQQMGYPFQTTQFLANTSLGLGSGMGGTSTTTQPQASGSSQILGGLMSGIGALGSSGAFGSAGWLTPLLFAARGGRVNGYAGGGAVSPFDIPDLSNTFIPQSPMGMAQGSLPQAPQIQQQGQQDPSGQMGMLAQLLKSKSPNSMPSPSAMLQQDIAHEDQVNSDAGGIAGVFNNMAKPGYFGDSGGADLMSRIGNFLGFAHGGPVGYAAGGLTSGAIDMDPNSLFGQQPMRTDQVQTIGDFSQADPNAGPVSFAPPSVTSPPSTSFVPQTQPPQLQQGQMGALPPPPSLSPPEQQAMNAAMNDGIDDSGSTGAQDVSGKPDPWLALMVAGAGTMAGTSPNAGTNIGRGLMAGLSNYQQQKSSALQASKLMEEIEYRKAMIDRGKYSVVPGTGTDENGKPVSGAYKINAYDGTTEFVPGVNIAAKGGGGDPAHIKEAKALVEAGAAPDFTTAYDMVRSGTNDFKTWNLAVQNAKKDVPLIDKDGNLIPDDQREALARDLINQRKAAMPSMRGNGTATPSVGAPPEGAINALKADPTLADQFDAKYGVGASKKYIK